MKLFDDWIKAAGGIPPKRKFTCEDVLEDAFRAGMLAAADIAWPKDGYVLDDYDEGKQQASMDIREAAE